MPSAQTTTPPAAPYFGVRGRPERSAPPAPFLPTSRSEMRALGWDTCDVVLVNGDAYVDHVSFGAALIGRLLEAHGFRVGIISQPDWRRVDDFRELGRPNVMWGVTAGNMDSLVNHYTSDRKIRSDDAYTPDGAAGERPDRAVAVYAHRCREAFSGVPVVIGGIEASLRRVAHYDYWSDKVRKSVLIDSKADMLLFGNAERAICQLAERLHMGESIRDITEIRGTAYLRHGLPEGWREQDSSTVDTPGALTPRVDPYAMEANAANPTCATDSPAPAPALVTLRPSAHPRAKTALRLPSHEQVASDPVLSAHASRVVHRESNPHNARALIQYHGDRHAWINPPPLPLSTPEMDAVYELPFQRRPHPKYGDAKIPAYEMIKTSIMINRGCFGGCSFCSITEHEGRIIQSRSPDSVIREIEQVRDTVPGFTGTISDLGGPTANMWRLSCKSPEIESKCRRPSCVFPGICENLNTDQKPLVQLYRRARAVPGVKRVMIASGVRYDLAVETPEYVKELASHHVGGYLKIAPEHIAEGPLNKMMKPGVGTYDRFKELFDRYSEAAGKKQYLIPYFIAAHPGTTDEDMLELALWLKKNRFKPDQVQAFLPSPMATATAMYHTRLNPLRRLRRGDSSLEVVIPKAGQTRRLHKALLRYHDPDNWPVIRKALRAMGRGDLIGNRPHQLVPHSSPGERRELRRGRDATSRGGPRRPRQGTALTQHTGLPPRETGERAGDSERTKKSKRRASKRRPPKGGSSKP